MALSTGKQPGVPMKSRNVISVDSNSLKFSTGNVFIILDSNDGDYWLQLHEAVIKHKSARISDMLSMDSQRANHKDLYLNQYCKIPAGITQVSILQGHEEPGKVPNLTLKQPSTKAQALNDNSRDSVGPNVSKFRDVYKSLFAAFYDEPLNVSNDDTQVALKQTEDLVEVAKTLQAVPAIRAQVSNVLQEFRQKIYVAIKDNPPRWLNLSLELESAPIFSEAIIHIIGCWPDWPWDTPRQALAPELVPLIEHKARALKAQRWEVDRMLLINTINYGEGDQLRSATLKEDPDAWLAVGIFRDWFVLELNSCATPSEIGRVYRKLLKGGDAYLTNAEVDPTVEWVGSNLDPDSIIKDLQLMKNFASKAVENICENGLMVSPDALDLGYLTCVDIRPDDYPW